MKKISLYTVIVMMIGLLGGCSNAQANLSGVLNELSAIEEEADSAMDDNQAGSSDGNTESSTDNSTDNTDNEAFEDVTTEDESTDSSDSEYSFEWPEKIPDELRSFEGVTLTAAAEDVYNLDSWTIFFECSDVQKVKDYITQLEALGYTQNSISENNFGLDYNGSGAAADVNINFVTGALSKLYITVK